MISRHPLGLFATTLLIGSACGRSSENPTPTPTAAPTAPILAELAPQEPDSATPEQPAEPTPEPATATGGEPDERPTRLSPDRASTDAPTGSVNPNLHPPEAEPAAAPDAHLAPSPNVDPSFQGKPLFIENDPLETSGVPICVVFIRGLSECWPKLDPEVRELTEDLLTEAVNLARSLKRPFVRERACEMGWDLATSAFAPKCPGVFPAEKPPTVRDD